MKQKNAGRILRVDAPHTIETFTIASRVNLISINFSRSRRWKHGKCFHFIESSYLNRSSSSSVVVVCGLSHSDRKLFSMDDDRANGWMAKTFNFLYFLPHSLRKFFAPNFMYRVATVWMFSWNSKHKRKEKCERRKKRVYVAIHSLDAARVRRENRKTEN